MSAAASPSISWWKRLTPLLLIQLYLNVTILLYAFGPWAWPMRDPGKLYTFVAAAHLAIALGYLSVAHRRPVEVTQEPIPRKLIRTCVVVSALMLPLITYTFTGRFIPNLADALRDPAEAYSAALEQVGTGNFAFFLRIPLAPFLIALFPLVLFYWARLPLRYRVPAVVVFLGTAALTVAVGQRRDVADYLIVGPFVLLAAHWSGVTRISRKVGLSILVASLLVATAFLAFFGYSHVSRVGTSNLATNPITLAPADPDNFMVRDLPPSFQPAVLAGLNYLTTSYYGLSLSLDRDFVPMYGTGHSRFLSYLFSRLLDKPELEWISYPARIGALDGFRYPVFWATAYPYFASDLTFVGTVFLMFLVGRVFCLAWIDCLGGKFPQAIPVLAMMAILMVYLPATNRMIQESEAVVAFYGWLLAWLNYRIPYARAQRARQELARA